MGQLDRLRSFAELAATRPVEFADRFLQRSPDNPPAKRPLTPATADPAHAVHSVLGVEQCTLDGDFSRARDAVFGHLGERHHHDGGLVLARVLYEFARHQPPRAVVETGVARGVSSAFVLTAMAENGAGHLWSSDLPPLGGEWREQSRSAVAPELQSRWSYVRGTSKRALPRIFEECGTVQLFVHDSLHSYENMMFEFRLAWEHLEPGGVLVSDDVDMNDSFADFADAVGVEPFVLGEVGKAGMVGYLRKPAAQ